MSESKVFKDQGGPNVDAIQDLVQPDDWALLVATASDLRPSIRGLQGSPFAEVMTVPRATIDGLFHILKPPFEEEGWRETWQKVIDEVNAAAVDVGRRCKGRIHVFVEGTTPLAMLVGHQLETHARGRALITHQYDSKPRKWSPFWTPAVAASEATEYFNTLKDLRHPGSGTAIVLGIESTTLISDEQLNALATQVGAGEAFVLRPLARSYDAKFLREPGQIAGAVEQIIENIRDLKDKNPHAALHLATTANNALMIEVAHRLPATVFRSIYIHDYVREADGYQCVLDLTEARLACEVSRSLLRITQNDGMLFYELDGDLLAAARPDVTATPHPEQPTRYSFKVHKGALPGLASGDLGLTSVDRRAEDAQTLYQSVAAHGAYLLPEVVRQRIQDRDSLDIEVALESDARLLDWPYLNVGNSWRPDFATYKDGWSVHLTGAAARAAHRPPVPLNELRVLLIPSMAPTDPVYDAVSLEKLAAQIKATGAQVTLLDPSAGLWAIGTQIAATSPHVIHWLAHGAADGPDLWNAVMEARVDDEMGVMNRQEFVELLTESKPRLIVLCSCSTGSPAPGYGVPGHLIERGVGAVLAFRETVYPEEVTPFFESFYAALLSGTPLKLAVSRARKATTRTPACPGFFGIPVLAAQDAGALEEITYRPVEASANQGKGGISLPTSEKENDGDGVRRDDGGIGLPTGDKGDDDDGIRRRDGGIGLPTGDKGDDGDGVRGAEGSGQH